MPIIIYEDESMFVLSKPAGLTVNKADTTRYEETLQDWVEKKLGVSHLESIKAEKLLPNGDYNPVYEFVNRAGIVHRLDKETSGIILVAKTIDAFAELQKQFKERTVKKTYIALVHGTLFPLEGEIDAPIGRLEFNRKRFGVVAGGREAKTLYKVLWVKHLVLGKEKEPLSLVELYPQTGRTHQIRVHLKHIHHPIFADPLYGGRKSSRDDREYLARVFLHASKIVFQHPETKEVLVFESPIPEELREFIHQLI